MSKRLSTLPPNARVWVYAADRKLSSEEISQILAASDNFLNEWAAHGAELKASADILNDHFLIIAADESFQMASGCSIDTSFRFVQSIGQQFQVDFFNRMNISFWLDNEVRQFKMKDLNQAIRKGQIDRQTVFFNQNIATLEELNSNWRVKAEESWLKRYFKAAETV